IMSWLLPQNKLARVVLPSGPSKTYSFSTLTKGSFRRCLFNSSRSFENFFSFTSSFLRAESQSFCATTLRSSVPLTVLILGIRVSFVLFGILFKLCQRGIHLIPRMRVGCPHIYLRGEPTRIIQARSSDRDNVRDQVGLAQNRRATFRAKAPMGLATHL